MLYQKDIQTTKTRKKKRLGLKIFLSILVVLIIARIALPYAVLHFANKKLAELDGYYGHIDDIDISLYRGAYQIKKLELRKITEKQKDTIDFLYFKNIDLAIEWKPIFKGKIVGKVLIDSSTILFTNQKNDISDVAKDTADFRDVMNSLMPITLNKLEIRNSFIRYRDPFSSPKLDMAMTNLNVIALNLANAYDSSKALPASITARANVYGGNLKLNVKLDPYAKQPKFDLDVRLERTNLVLLNDFLRAYANFDVNKGIFGLYAEVATKNGKFDGYVKPLIYDLDVVDFKKEKEKGIRQLAYESLIASGAWIFKNHPKDQLGTKIALSGELKDPSIRITEAILTVLKNAFISPLKPNIDSDVNLGTINKEKKENFLDKAIEKRSERKKERKQRKAAKQATKQKSK